jgi:hypothetical protein
MGLGWRHHSRSIHVDRESSNWRPKTVSTIELLFYPFKFIILPPIACLDAIIT